MKNNKGILIIAFSVVTLALLIGGFTIFSQAKSKKTFAGDGYILKPSEEVNVTTTVNEQFYFTAGTPYKEKYQTIITFKDSQGEQVELPTTEFVHYMDDSLGAFTKGVILNVDDVSSDQVNYYSVSKNTILLSNGDLYTMTSLGQAINLTEFVWKISDYDYMVVSPEITLSLGKDNEITLEKYAQLKYIENGIVRIIHKDGTWQTVSNDACLYTTSGAEINLCGKSFMVDGEQTVCFDKMMINDESNIAIDENEAPEITIPTFNVINGKDGSSGTSGANGTDGEEGEAGEAGEEAAEGAAGGSGTAGTSGEEGEQGATGEEGVWGYDGRDGKDAQNQNDTGIVSVDLYAKPTVDISTFQTSTNSVSMQMQLIDKDGSVVAENANELAIYKVYDRATMTEVANGSGTLGDIAKNVTVSGLKPDTEYIILVDGKYIISDEDGINDVRGTNFLTKIFKTDKLGLVLTKYAATESEIAVQVTNTNTAIQSYNVAMYGFNPDGSQYCMGYYTVTGDEARNQTLQKVFNDTNLTGMSGLSGVEADYLGNTAHTMKSNTTYVFKIASVTINSEIITVDETVDITTLKKKPYYTITDLDGITQQPVTYKQPVLAPNLKDHSMVVTLEAPNDDDHGITKYKCELYKAGSSSPIQSTETLSLDTMVFNLPSDEFGTGYYAIMRIEFFDNEKTIEYTLTSATEDLSESTFPTVEFIYDANAYDSIRGYLKVDNKSGLMPSTLSNDYPLMLSIISDYDTIRNATIINEVSTPAGQVSSATTSYYRFEFNGLKSDTLYQLTLRGPVLTTTDYSNWDSMLASGGAAIAGPMKDTYIAGSTRTTASIRPMSLVGTTFIGSGSNAFNFLYNITSAGKGTPEAVDASLTEYQVDRTESLQFELFMLEGDDPEGNKTKLGQTATVKDLNAMDLTSDFKTVAYTATDKTKSQMDNDQTLSDYNTQSIVAAGMGMASAVLTPESFGLNANDTRLFTDSKYMIRVSNATDYRGDDSNSGGLVSGSINTANVMPFAGNENSVVFEIKAKHTRLANPNNAFTVNPITKGSLSGEALNLYGYENVGGVNVELDDSTIVGYKLLPDYSIRDALKVTYNVYRIKDDQTTIDNSTPVFYSQTVLNEAPDTSAYTNPNRNADAGEKFELVYSETLDVPALELEDYRLYFKNIGGLHRGDRFFVAFEVLSDYDNDATKIDCDENNENDLYPFCTYGVRYFERYSEIPMYRTTVLAAPKQEPTIERYPVSGNTPADMLSTARWNYRIMDPDHTITNLYTTGQNALFQILIGNSTRNVTVAGGDYSSFKEVDITGLHDGEVYTTRIPYKEYSTTVAEENPVKNIDSQGIKFQSAKTFTDPYTKVTVTNTEWQGGYQVRLTLEGTDVFHMAGAKVTVAGTGTDHLNHEVVYDYVPIDLKNTYKDSGNSIGWGYLTLSTSKLVTLANAGVTDISFTVEGYLNTHEMGFKNTNDPTAVYAMKELKPEGNYDYVLYDQRTTDLIPIEKLAMVNNVGAGSYQHCVSSFFAAPDHGGLDIASKTLKMTYSPTNDLYDSQVSFDQNGLLIGTKYYTIERLALKELTIDDSYQTMALGDIYPAISYVRGVPGATGEIMYFEVSGEAARDNFPVYAEVKNTAGQFLTMNVETSAETGKHYYRVNGTSTEQVLTDGSILTYSVNGKYYVDMDIRGLEPDSTYKVNFYTKDLSGNKISLYSIERDTAGYEYTFKTNKYVVPMLEGPVYTWNNYADKSASFRFYVNEGDGLYMKAYWRLEDVNGNVLNAGNEGSGNYITRIGEATSYPYYTANVVNPNISQFTMGVLPGAPYLKLGQTYQIAVKVLSTTNGEILSGSDDGWVNVTTFTVNSNNSNPAMFPEPAFNIQCTKGSNYISVFSTVVNDYKAIINDIFTISISDVNGNVLQSVSDVPADYKNKETKFVGLQPNTTYNITVTANLDLDNNGVQENAFSAKYNVTTQSGANAEVSGARNQSGYLYITLNDVSNFSEVTKVSYTVWSDGNVMTSGSQSITPGSTGYSLDTTYAIADGTYHIEVQYFDSSDNRLSQGNGTAVIK